MKKIFLWFWLLTKRLYKKPAFLVLMLLIPVLVFGYGLAARGDSGIVTVTTFWEDSDDAARGIVAHLENNNQLTRFVRCSTPDAARQQVEMGKADAAWIFEGDTAEKIRAFGADPENAEPFIRVIQREDDVLLMLTRENLGGAAYTATAKDIYLSFIRSSIPELNYVSDGALLEAFDTVSISENLFTFSSRDGNAQAGGYLLSPVRGMLAVIVVLCGLATAMYYLQDRQSGTFAWLPQQRQPLAELGCQAVSVINVSLVAFLSMAVSGLTGSLPLELALLILYGLDVSLFCLLLRRCFGSIKVLATVIPLLVVVMLVVCPVFFEIPMLQLLQFLFPPTYFIHGIYSPIYLLYLAAHAALCALLYALIGRFKA